VRPDRTPTGYRTYRDHHVERLAFIRRAKGFGLSLGEITELLGLRDEDRCAPVQDRLRTLVDDKIAEASTRLAELEAFTAELRRVSAALDAPAPEGPCGDTCGCTSDVAAGAVSVRFGRHVDADLPVACVIPAERVDQRVVGSRS
jgi:DNA-binding transcriptional MerR regulator